MGLSLLGKIAGNYNKTNDTLTAGEAIINGAESTQDFLGNWMTNKLPEIITGLAVRVVDDGSGTIAKEIGDAAKGDGFLGGLINGN